MFMRGNESFNSMHAGYFLHALLPSGLFHGQLLQELPSGIIIRASNRLDTDQARHFVGPDLGSNCLQSLSTDDKSPLTGKEYRKKLSRRQ